MIQTVEVLNYRCLRYIRQDLNKFHVLVGPNASGKTTFFDAIAFVGDVLSDGLEAAITRRTQDFRDLTWRREGQPFEIALNLTIPEERRKLLGTGAFDICRYELTIGTEKGTDEIAILNERVLLTRTEEPAPRQEALFPATITPPNTISKSRGRGVRTVINKVLRNDNFYDETGKGWDHAFKLGPRKSALANLPDDETLFPVTTWAKSTLMEGVQALTLNSGLMRLPSPPVKSRTFRPDGSNLPWVIRSLAEKEPGRIRDWVRHLRTALPDLEDIRTVEREEDRHRYLVVCYKGGLEVPSWMVSDGTLRLMALTLPAYLRDFHGVYLIEEPENGIHPKAVETMYQSLSSVYGAQILLATHSTVILSIADAGEILCFAKDEEGATDIVKGNEHPALKEWRGETNLGVLFAGGVLG